MRNLVVNGTTYEFPDAGEAEGWGEGLADWASAVTAGMLQKSGGAFTLTADVNFGATYGLISAYFKSRTADVAHAGALRLARADVLSWRNEANTADLALGVDTDGDLTFSGAKIEASAAAAQNAADAAQMDATQALADAFAVAMDLSNHEGDVSAHGVTGDVVGTGGAQTLTDKSIAASDNNITGLTNDNIAANANIAYSKLSLSYSLVAEDFSPSAVSGDGGKIVLQDSPALETPSVDGGIHLEEISGPANLPAAGYKIFYPKTDGKFYALNSSGVEVPVGSGSGGSGINLVENPNAESDLTGYTDSGTSTVASRTTTTADIPLYPYKETAIKITNSGSGTDYTSFDVTVPPSLVNTELELSWYQKPSSTYVSSDYEVQVFSGASEIATRDADTSGDTFIPASTGKFRTSFNPGGASAIQVRIKRAAGVSSSFISLNEITVGPGAGVATGPNIGPWTAYTPSNTQGFGTLASSNLVYQRVGSSLFITGDFTSGTVTASEAQIALPTGLTAQYNSSSRIIVGHMDIDRTQSATRSERYPVLANNGATYLRFGGDSSVSASNPTSTTTGNGAFYNSTRYTLTVGPIPIAEWSGGSNVYLGSNDVEYLSHDGTNTVYGPNGSLVPNQAVGTAVTRLITVPSNSSVEDWILEYNVNGNGWAKAADAYPYMRQGSNTYGLQAFWNPGNQVLVRFGAGGVYGNGATYGANSSIAWSVGYAAGDRWRLRRCKAGSPVGFGMATAENAGLVSREAFTTVVLSGSGTSSMNGTLNIARVGRVVTITSTGAITHTSGSSAQSADGVIPSGFRPVGAGGAAVIGSFAASGGTVQFFVSASGRISLAYGAANTSTTNPFNITYVVAD